MFDAGTTIMSCPALNLPLHIRCGAYRRHSTTHANARCLTTALIAKPSSVLLPTDDSASSAEPGCFPTGHGSKSSDLPGMSLPTTVGVLGGTSASSTIDFLNKLIMRRSSCTTDGPESIPFIVCNDPALNKELSSYERTSVTYLNSRNRHVHFDPGPIVAKLRHKRTFLENSGARCIVMPCHTPHLWFNEISEGCSVPFLHAGDCVAEELKAAGLKPVEAGSSVRIGVLGTDVIVKSGFYQERLRNQGFEVLLPDKATMEHTVAPAFDAYNRMDIEGARNLLRIALQVLLVRAASTVILAFDDLRGILPRDDPLRQKCIDPMDALVRSTIRWAESAQTLSKGA